MFEGEFNITFIVFQQSSSVRHPYSRETREARLRSIQRRLGLNPETGKPLANNPPPSSSASLAGLGAQTGTGPNGDVVVGEDAFSFAMKPRCLSSTYRTRVHSTSSEDNSPASASTSLGTTVAGSAPAPVASARLVADLSSTRARVARARSVSGPVESGYVEAEKTRQLLEATKQILDTTSGNQEAVVKQPQVTTGNTPETTGHLQQTNRYLSENTSHADTRGYPSESIRHIPTTTNHLPEASKYHVPEISRSHPPGTFKREPEESVYQQAEATSISQSGNSFHQTTVTGNDTRSSQLSSSHEDPNTRSRHVSSETASHTSRHVSSEPVSRHVRSEPMRRRMSSDDTVSQHQSSMDPPASSSHVRFSEDAPAVPNYSPEKVTQVRQRGYYCLFTIKWYMTSGDTLNQQHITMDVPVEV